MLILLLLLSFLKKRAALLSHSIPLPYLQIQPVWLGHMRGDPPGGSPPYSYSCKSNKFGSAELLFFIFQGILGRAKQSSKDQVGNNPTPTPRNALSVRWSVIPQFLPHLTRARTPILHVSMHIRFFGGGDNDDAKDGVSEEDDNNEEEEKK